VLEFLDLKDEYSENKLEEALILGSNRAEARVRNRRERGVARA
jgi:predicted nuclease of restriction endonuclease-like (RecB) superfamily